MEQMYEDQNKRIEQETPRNAVAAISERTGESSEEIYDEFLQWLNHNANLGIEKQLNKEEYNKFIKNYDSYIEEMNLPVEEIKRCTGL